MPRFYGARPSSCASAPRSTPSAAPRSSSQIFALFDDALAESAPPARPPHTPAWPGEDEDSPELSVGEPSQPAPPAEAETAPAEASSGSETEMEFEHFALH